LKRRTVSGIDNARNRPVQSTAARTGCSSGHGGCAGAGHRVPEQRAQCRDDRADRIPLGDLPQAIGEAARRGYLREERRQYTLSREGQELVARLDAAHREGIQAYVDQLSPDDSRQLDAAFGIAR